jgi:hypothetical protein
METVSSQLFSTYIESADGDEGNKCLLLAKGQSSGGKSFISSDSTTGVIYAGGSRMGRISGVEVTAIDCSGDEFAIASAKDNACDVYGFSPDEGKFYKDDTHIQIGESFALRPLKHTIAWLVLMAGLRTKIATYFPASCLDMQRATESRILTLQFLYLYIMSIISIVSIMSIMSIM